jgi:hypothetical protein
VSKNARPHPTWFTLTGRPDGHDPHESARHRVEPDNQSDTTIEAYLIQLDQYAKREPFAAIELNSPGDDPTAYLLTLAQLRHLEQAFGRLLTTAGRI